MRVLAFAVFFGSAAALWTKPAGNNHTSCTDDANARSQCEAAHAAGHHLDVICDRVICEEDGHMSEVESSDSALLETKANARMQVYQAHSSLARVSSCGPRRYFLFATREKKSLAPSAIKPHLTAI